MVKISEFQTKDVINVLDGKKLGTIRDLELDLLQGKIESLIIPAQGKILGLFGGGTEYIIPWKNIVKIGIDVVLVKLETSYRQNNLNEDYNAFNKKLT